MTNILTKLIFILLVGALSLNAASWQKIATSASVNTNVVDFFKDGSGVALFKFDGNANDAGGVYNSLFSGVATYSSGKLGQKATISGVASGSAGVPCSASSGGCAVSYWTNNEGTRDRAFGFFQDTSHYIGVYYGGDKFFDGSSSPKTMGFVIENTSTMKHYVWSFASGNVLIYENKILKTTIPMASGFTKLNSFTDGGATTTMTADQVRIFNRALTQAEVTQLYNEGAQ